MSLANPSNPLHPTFEGHISSTLDALILFEACLSGQLNHVPRRPHDRERQDLIKSGNVFIYEEHASGIKRWTDGVSWSPSRILGNFLIYRELEKPFPPGEKKRALKKSKKPQQGVNKNESTPRPSINFPPIDPSTVGKDSERALIGSLIDSYPFKNDGLVKKTISISFQGVPHHLVSYYNVNDVTSGRLVTPSKDPHLRGIIPRSELMLNQSFRAPIDEVECGTDDRGPGAYLGGYPGGPEYPQGSLLQRALSLPNPNSTHYEAYGPSPNYGYTTLPPPAGQPPHHQHPFVSTVSTTAPSMAFAPSPQNNYALDPNRPRFAHGPGIMNEFPRNMPTHGLPATSPPRRHSTFDQQPVSDLSSMTMAPVPEARSVPPNTYLNSNSYYMPHRPASIPTPDHGFPSPPTRQMKAEPDGLPATHDESAHGYEYQNGGQWGFGNMDNTGQDAQYYGGNSEGASQQWPNNGPNSLGRG